MPEDRHSRPGGSGPHRSRAGRLLRRALPRERLHKSDVIAGLPGAVGSVPDGMAAGVLAGVSPVHGLYASMAGPLFGGLTTSTRLMVVTTTNASALATGSALSHVDPRDRAAAVTLLTLLAGAVMIVAAVLRLGRYTRFVSHSVMTGFLLGISANIVFTQLGDLAGAEKHGSTAVSKAAHVLAHPGTIDPSSLVVGVFAMVLIVALARTRLRLFGSVAALVLPTALAAGLGWDSVQRVSDVGTIPTGIPLPRIPDFGLLSPSLIVGALAVAVIVLVQGAGVAESVPNPDGARSKTDRDFAAQGIGNLAVGLFRGMPVGGAMGETSLNRAAGARTRWAALCTGLWMVAILAAFAGVVGLVAMPTLAAVLIVAAVGSIDRHRITAIWSSGAISRIALVTTFLATLLLPVTIAVGTGVGLSLLMQLNREAVDLKVVRLRVDGDRLVEDDAPKQLSDNAIVILDVYGSLFYAGARTLQAQLPDPAAARSPVVILRLRGRTTLNATFFAVIAGYARRLEQVGGSLYLSGMDRRIYESWTNKVLAGHGVRLEFFPATATLGESTLAAYAQARVRGAGPDDA